MNIPDPPSVAGSYEPIMQTTNLIFVSGQIPLRDGTIVYTGKVSDANLAMAQESAKLCAINLLAQIKSKLGSLDKIQFVRVSGFVNAVPEFTQHPKVIDAASRLLVDVLGERGKHTRIAVGVSSLPANSMTELDAIVQI